MILQIHRLYSSKINQKFINWKIINILYIAVKIMVHILEMIFILIMILLGSSLGTDYDITGYTV